MSNARLSSSLAAETLWPIPAFLSRLRMTSRRKRTISLPSSVSSLMKSASSSIGRDSAGVREWARPFLERADGFQEISCFSGPVFGECTCGGEAVAHLGVFVSVAHDVEEEAHDFAAAVGFLSYEFGEGLEFGFGLGVVHMF